MIDEPIDPDDRAEWLIEQGRVDEAISILEARTRGGDWLDVDLLSDLLVENGRVEEAEALWRAAIEAGLPRAYGGFADMLADAGRTDEAIAGWRAAVEVGEPRARARLAALLARTGRVDEAIAEYWTAIAAGDAAAGVRLAKVYARAGQLDEAVRAYRSAIGAEGVSRWPLGVLLEKLGHVDEAVAAYRAAVDAGEGHVRVRLLAAQGRLEEATQLVRDMLTEPGHNASYRRLGWLLTEQRRFEEIEAEARLLKDGNLVGLSYLLSGAQQSANFHEDCPADCKGSTRVVRYLPECR
ncbi:tetratricopeptide repeat protein [Micromonospora purpureochromogenes]|uniref:tetratricopeptide repeat protein n=1 Tax=Micromonospora purpureochromogenes TaxID=47872 RepID=UPI0033E5E7D2